MRRGWSVKTQALTVWVEWVEWLGAWEWRFRGVGVACGCMARLLTIDSCTVALRNALLGALRTCDEAILLPQSAQSMESAAFKNVAFRLCGATNGIQTSIFSQDWFTGISLVKLKGDDLALIEEILGSPSRRTELLKTLGEKVNSEVSNSTLEVGPSLESDADERDLEETSWNAGFDSPSCFVGVFSANHSKTPDGGKCGMQREHKDYYLVCRAGAGTAASTFHSRLLASLQKGSSLDQALETEIAQPGPQALRRLAMAGFRNRSRIMLDAVHVLGLKDVSSVGDQAARNKHRGVVADVDTIANTIRKLDDSPRSTWQYSTCVDGASSKGITSLSNQADGVILFVNENGDQRISLKNETWGCIPFGSKRIATSREMVDLAVKAHSTSTTTPHPDSHWISTRFGWNNRQFSSSQPSIEPFGLWGAYSPENYIQTFARELGIASYQAVRLRPELVCSAGVDAGKLRAVVKAVDLARKT